jgi:hypothetical protein
MTTDNLSMPTEAARTAEPDLRGFLIAHAGFRTEYGRLADAAEAVRDDDYAALIEDQITLVGTHLEHHHGDEDAWMWPLLRSRIPQALPVLDALEEQHEQLDPLLHAIGDRGQSLKDRALSMRLAHQLLNEHLDQEERDAVPLMRTAIRPDEFAEAAARVTKLTPRKELPTVFCWLGSCADPAQVAGAIEPFPWPVRFLFREVWWPTYRRRYFALYGVELRRHPDR